MKIKVCGLKYPENIKAAAGLQPDYMGFIFYAPSPRYVEEVPAGELNAISPLTYKTAVFVNETEENISKLIDKYGFDAIQLHGNENPEFCEHFKGRVKVIKAFGLDAGFDFAKLKVYENSVDYFLFDTKTEIHGGSGNTFNWKLLDQYRLPIPFFLSGGISQENLEEVKKITHPHFFGVDLNSRFETAPGMKDIQQLEKAFGILK